MDDQEYEIDAIIDYHIENSKKRYLVKWKFFPKSEATWEPEKKLKNCQRAIEKFHKFSKVSF